MSAGHDTGCRSVFKGWHAAASICQSVMKSHKALLQDQCVTGEDVEPDGPVRAAHGSGTRSEAHQGSEGQ